MNLLLLITLFEIPGVAPRLLVLPRLTTTFVPSLKIPTYPLPKSVLISFIFSKGNELKSSSAFSSFLNLLALATGQSLLAISTANTLRKSNSNYVSLALFSWLNFANFKLDIPNESLGEPLDTPPMSFSQFALSDSV